MRDAHGTSIGDWLLVLLRYRPSTFRMGDDVLRYDHPGICLGLVTEISQCKHPDLCLVG
jgi:hypothetical protein